MLNNNNNIDHGKNAEKLCSQGCGYIAKKLTTRIGILISDHSINELQEKMDWNWVDTGLKMGGPSFLGWLVT